MMDFRLTTEQALLVDTATKLGSKFGPDYWLKKDQDSAYPHEFLSKVGELGFFGLHLPEEFGGSNAGITDQVLAMQALCAGGGGAGPALGLLFGILGSNAVLHHGNPQQQKRYLPRMASGELLASLAVTEPDAGTNTLKITTFASKQADSYVIQGRKWFITNIEESGAVLLLARTTKGEGSSGLSLFLIDLPQQAIEATPIATHGLHYYKSYDVNFDSLQVPETCLIGEEGKGFHQLLATLNPERMLVAAGAIGTGQLALAAAVQYAKERNVFGVPIASHQAVQHPLAGAHAKLSSAWLIVLRAASMHDAGEPQSEVGAVANMAKFVAVEAAVEACYHAMQTLGGPGFAAEFHVERWWREVQLFRIAPVTQQMSLNYIGEHVLGMPKSY